MHQGYIEPHACVVDARGRRLGPGLDVQQDALPLPRHAGRGPRPARRRGIVIHHVHIGGDFGGKGAPRNDAMLAYHLARASGRPVSLVLTYAEELTAANPRHPATVYLKTGVKRDGTIVAREAASSTTAAPTPAAASRPAAC